MFLKINKGKMGAYPKVTFINPDHIAKFEAVAGPGVMDIHFLSAQNVEIERLKIERGNEDAMQLLRSLVGDETTAKVLSSLSDNNTDA